MTKRPVIGVLGGGQLGRMLQEAAAPLGIELVVLDAADCPTKQINSNPKHVTGSITDPEKVRELAAKCDYITVEIEHVTTGVLEEIATEGVTIANGQIKKVPVHPSWETIRLIQDKYLQKEHFGKAGIPIAPQTALEGGAPVQESLRKAAKELGLPFMLKARKGSYDGRGNFKVSSEDDFEEAAKALGTLPLYAEKWVPFKKELSCLVVRSEDDQGTLRDVYPYPAVETVHQDSICTKVFHPPRQVSTDACKQAEKVASDVVRTLKGRGVFAVEMFVLEDGSIAVNEVAPRVHNSYHHSIECFPQMSQFKAQLCSILDILPKSGLKLKPRVAKGLMLNILGGAREESHNKLVDMAFESSTADMDVFLHLYGKASKPARKIGHITVTTHDAEADLEQLAAPLIQEVDCIRDDRVKAASASLRPSATAGPSAPTQPASKTSRDPLKPLVVVTMGSDSDMPVLKPGLQILEKFNVPYDVTITSAHRTPHKMVELGQSAAARGVRVLIAAAGGAAHLPGMLASETTVPVIGVPIKATHLDGNDSLLSIVQMPRGCPVATVGINNSTNAALLAIKILGSTDSQYRTAMAQYMKNMSDEVVAKAEKLHEIGWEEYLSGK
ncbi:phosphoribosylaminoimidazole carboxylase [Xylariomycetidae sp. FL0641]|nr:phosphoribosylaminoimidazole carboxylase [Xylariomycetidae sp. FL0641]